MSKNIELTPNSNIIIERLDLLTTGTPFYHVDRMAPFHVLIYCINGCIYVGEEDSDSKNEYAVGPGELLLLKSGLHQYPTERIEAGTSWIYAHFYTTESEKSMEESISLPKQIDNLKNSTIADGLHNLVDIITSESDLKEFIAPLEFHKILIEIYKWSKGASSPDLFDEITRYLYSLPTTHLTSTKLENHFHLSYKYMEHIFKQKSGTSIMQYHTKIRIKESAKTLRATNLSVASISEMYGFNDQLYFSRCFKKHMGMSPKDYRTSQIIL